MKNTICTNIAVLAVAGLALTTRAETSPGYVEFGKLTPPGKGAEFVEVQIRSNLLGLAAGIVAKENPEAAKVIRSVELIQVNVVGITKENRAELDQRLAKVRADLDAKNWERNVSVQGKKGEDVAVFTKTRGAEALAGIAINQFFQLRKTDGLAFHRDCPASQKHFHPVDRHGSLADIDRSQGPAERRLG